MYSDFKIDGMKRPKSKNHLKNIVTERNKQTYKLNRTIKNTKVISYKRLFDTSP